MLNEFKIVYNFFYIYFSKTKHMVNYSVFFSSLKSIDVQECYACLRI